MTTALGWVTNLIGSGAGLVAIGVGALAIQHHGRFPKFAHPWLSRLLIVVMYAGGAALAVTTIGHTVDHLITWVASWFGGLNYGIFHALLLLAILFLLVGVVVGFLLEPDPSVAMVAIFLPVLLALPFGGLLHTIATTLNAPALDLASSLNHMLGG